MAATRSGASPKWKRKSTALRLVCAVLLSGILSAYGQNETISESSPSPNPGAPAGTSKDLVMSQAEAQAQAAQLYAQGCASSCASTAVVTRMSDASQIQMCVGVCIVSASGMATEIEPDTYLNWPEGNSLFSYMNGVEFAHFNVLLLFGSVTIAGLGSEVIVGQYIVENLDPDAAAALWVYAQVVFPIFISIGVFAQSVFGLPFLVLGMWKFGFPETLAYWVKVNMVRKKRGWFNAECFGNICNGSGLLFHHISSAYFVTCGSVGYNQLTRYARGMMTPLVLQHWVVLIRYIHFNTYVVLALALEILWEFEVFYGVRYLRKNFEVAIIFLLLAHWLFLLGYFFEMLDKYLTPKQGNTKGEPDILAVDFQNPNHRDLPEDLSTETRDESYFGSRQGLMKSLFDAVAQEEDESPRNNHGRASLLNAGLGGGNKGVGRASLLNAGLGGGNKGVGRASLLNAGLGGGNKGAARGRASRMIPTHAPAPSLPE